ncbi:MAG: HD domain-containing protein [Anaerolineales bacterium]|nr:HD domain-containing protein [Anaerolineales bacterium]
MNYDDQIYGSVVITEPVLLDLMESQAMRRLQGVLQHGITGLIGVTEAITRFDHSVGAMLLVRQLGGSVEEQIGALLHDVSHTAFSHVIDHALDEADTQSYHDDVKEEYVANTDIPEILAQHGYQWQNFVDETQFPLLEQPAPMLCADRLDYFLRDSVPLGLSTVAEVQELLPHLLVYKGQIMVDDLDTARWLGDTFMAADDASWANFWEVGLYEVTARAIRRAMEIGVFTKDDFWLTDKVAWQKLWAADDEELQKWLKLVRKDVDFVWDEGQADFHVSPKIRTIDPYVVLGGQVRPLSLWDVSYAQRRVDYLERKSANWPMRVVV